MLLELVCYRKYFCGPITGKSARNVGSLIVETYSRTQTISQWGKRLKCHLSTTRNTIGHVIQSKRKSGWNATCHMTTTRNTVGHVIQSIKEEKWLKYRLSTTRNSGDTVSHRENVALVHYQELYRTGDTVSLCRKYGWNIICHTLRKDRTCHCNSRTPILWLLK